MRALAGEEMLGVEEAWRGARTGLGHRNAGDGTDPATARRTHGEIRSPDDERAELKELNVAIHMSKSKANAKRLRQGRPADKRLLGR